MSHIDELIRQHCPNGVEYRAIGEAGEVFRGRRFTKTDYVEEGLAAIHYGELYTHYETSATEVVARVRTDLAPNLRFAKPGDVVIAEVGETLEDVGKAVAWLGTEEVAIHDGCYGFRSELNPAFVSYYLQTAAFHAEKNRHVARAKVKRLSIQGLKQVRIPVPPLEVQGEIVRVLDLFHALDAELDAELETRRSQYAHYLDYLLTFSDPDPLSRERVRWVAMGELGEIYRGRRFTKDDYVLEGLAAIHYGDLYTEYGTSTSEAVTHVRPDLEPNLRFAQPGDVVIAEVGETVEDVGKATAWLGETKVAIHDGCYGFRHSMNPLFVAYYLQTAAFRAEKSRYVARAKVKRLSLSGLKRVLMPVPSMAEQDRIVGILSSFDALVNDLSVGLPAELAARRTQYEYYRDRLLTFEGAA